jgi:hypothetical protein
MVTEIYSRRHGARLPDNALLAAAHEIEVFFISIKEIEGAIEFHGFKEDANRNAVEIFEGVILLDKVEKALQQVVLQRGEIIPAMVLEFFPDPVAYMAEITPAVIIFCCHHSP